MTFTVRRLMAAVAVLGLVLAAGRAHFALGSFVAGALSIAWIEAGREARRREAAGAAVGVLGAVALFARWAGMAATLLVWSMAPVVLIAPLLVPEGGCRPGPGPVVLGVILPWALVASACVSRWLRRACNWGWTSELPTTGPDLGARRTPMGGASDSQGDAPTDHAGPVHGR